MLFKILKLLGNWETIPIGISVWARKFTFASILVINIRSIWAVREERHQIKITRLSTGKDETFLNCFL